MSLKSSFLVPVLLFFALACQSNQSSKSLAKKEFKTLIEASEIASLVSQDGYVVVDLRPYENYKAGHLPNAIQLWRTDIEDAKHTSNGMMLTKEALQSLFSEKGITNEDTLILYDDKGSCEAARLWWILDNYGITTTRIVNGGVSALLEAGFEFNTKEPIRNSTNFIITQENPVKHIEGVALKALLDQNVQITIVDTRTKNEYSGYRNKKGAGKAGRIPTSIHIDWAKAVDYNASKKFRSIEELEKIYHPHLPNKNEPIIVYCHSGVRSAHTTFVLTELLGYTNVKNYDGSWTEWSNYDLPIEYDVKTEIFE